MREILGPPQEQRWLTEDEIHAWWYFLQGFAHTETATDGTIAPPFTAMASQTLKRNISMEST